jgi:integrase/recombinase XerD
MIARRGTLAPDIAAFLAFKRTLGCKYDSAEQILTAFDHFVAKKSPRRGGLKLAEMVPAWLARNDNRTAATVGNELGYVRQLCLYRRRRDPKAYVPPRGLAQPTAKRPFFPHVFSATTIRRLLRLTAALFPGFQARLYRTLIMILYCTGLRPGEALRLRFRDVDLMRGAFFIAPSKGRARWVPFHRSLTRELQAYFKARRAFAPGGAEDPIFINTKRRRLPHYTLWWAFLRLFRMAGLKPASGRGGPRPYDLRHTFAVHRLTRWYRAGVDLHARLPWLSAYMGHDNILGTEVYLSATPELLQLASSRLRRRFHTARRGP